jgi:hypothetical protein
MDELREKQWAALIDMQQRQIELLMRLEQPRDARGSSAG